jgi:surface protein
VTNFGAFASGCTNLTTLDVSGWDTSSVTAFNNFAVSCSNLTTLDVSGWDTSSVTNFNGFVFACSNLTTLDVSGWDTSSVTNFGAFASGCTNLTTVTVTGGTGNPFADSPCTNYINAFANTNLTQSSIDDILVAIESAGTSSGTFNQSGGSAPSATGEAAIDALRGRGWTITVTGGY